MLSAFFIDRPRFAIVIALIVTLAGGIALTRIPLAQFPAIVPPQVQVTVNYPGASAKVVEQTVAQPIEEAVNGLNDEIYMSSTSGNDGSYSLTVSFRVGSDPDIDTVNVTNAVQQATSQLPAEVQQEGITVRKRSSAVLAFLFFVIVNNLYRQETAQIVSFTLIALAALISSYAAAQMLTGSNHVWNHISPYTGRASGTYISPNNFAALLEMLLPLAVAYLLAGRVNVVTRILLGYAAVVMALGLAVTMRTGPTEPICSQRLAEPGPPL